MASRASRAAAACALLLHAQLGAAALWLLPRGFSPRSAHFWSNTALPAASLALALAALLRLAAGSPRPAALLTAAAASGWACAAPLGLALFPRSAPPLSAVAAAGALALGAVAWSLRSVAGRAAWAAAAAGALAAAALLWAQRGAEPATRPAGGALADAAGPADGASRSEREGMLELPCGGASLGVEPLLTFESRSPDRTWTVLAPPDAFGPRRTVRALLRAPGDLRARYDDDGESSLWLRRGPAGLSIEAVSSLPRPVYSHLNSWTSLRFRGDAEIRFGPTGARSFAVEPADYPAGRPAQMANLHADEVLRVVRASSGEKGPFHLLAEGPLRRGQPLAIELRRASGQGCRLVFEDWSAQVSAQPSPTAGWGVPENSIQFFSQGGSSLILLTLADTGPGRGWDSVGHAAGVYRNRMRIEPLAGP